MRSARLLAGVLGAVLAAGATHAVAADLDPYAKQRYGSAYEDPRYADIYGQEPRYAPPGYGRHYGGPHHAPPPPPPLYAPQHHSDNAPGCVPREIIRQQLLRDGWNDFHAAEMRERHAVVNARRPNGDLYRLRIDRCSGAIVAARPIGPNQGPHAQGPYGGPGPYAEPGPYAHPGPYAQPGPYAYGPRPYLRPY